jgi:hypothetical protein
VELYCRCKVSVTSFGGEVWAFWGVDELLKRFAQTPKSLHETHPFLQIRSNQYNSMRINEK